MTSLALWVLKRAFFRPWSVGWGRQASFSSLCLNQFLICLLIHYSFHWVSSSWKVLAFERVLSQSSACLDWRLHSFSKPFCAEISLIPQDIPQIRFFFFFLSPLWSLLPSLIQFLRIPFTFLLINHFLNEMVNSNGLTIIFPGFLDVLSFGHFRLFSLPYIFFNLI